MKQKKPDGYQAPTTGVVATRLDELIGIVTHPAFRIGFLDAQHGRPFDHDRIDRRMLEETPATAWKRMRITPNDLFFSSAIGVQLAQYRYEEGRLLVLQEGVKCKKWGHPDFPPAQVKRYIWRRLRP